MAIGAANMAHTHHGMPFPVSFMINSNVKMTTSVHITALVTRMSALQDIASMQVLCSDKTGTITTAKLTIFLEKSICYREALLPIQGSRINIGHLSLDDDDVVRDLIIAFAYLGSNPAKVNDAVDSSVVRSFLEADKRTSGKLKRIVDSFERIEITGFDPELKRTVATVKHKASGQVITSHIAKGIPNKVLDTSDGGEDHAPRQWRCVQCNSDTTFISRVNKVNDELASGGYKTIAVALSLKYDPHPDQFHFLGLLPM
jgi:H+-transporting ATPase